MEKSILEITVQLHRSLASLTSHYQPQSCNMSFVFIQPLTITQTKNLPSVLYVLYDQTHISQHPKTGSYQRKVPI